MMKKLMATVISVLLSIASALPCPSHAQTKTGDSAAPSGEANQLSFDRTSSWSIIINRDVQTQELQIPAEAKRDESQKFLLSALSAFTKGELVKMNAEIIQTTKGQMLVLSPATGNKMVTLQNQDGNFEGTMTNPKGIVLNVKLQKLSEKELADIRSRHDRDPIIKDVASDVPTSCSRFIGGWSGDWSFGKRWLWITEIDAKCIARYSYGQQRPRDFKSIEIKDGEFSFPCGSSGGTCYFNNHGDELWGRYAEVGGANTAVFRKIPGPTK